MVWQTTFREHDSLSSKKNCKISQAGPLFSRGYFVKCSHLAIAAKLHCPKVTRLTRVYCIRYQEYMKGSKQLLHVYSTYTNKLLSEYAVKRPHFKWLTVWLALHKHTMPYMVMSTQTVYITTSVCDVHTPTDYCVCHFLCVHVYCSADGLLKAFPNPFPIMECGRNTQPPNTMQMISPELDQDVSSPSSDRHY